MRYLCFLKNNKGQMKTITRAIILIASLILIITLVTKIYNSTNEQVDDSLCSNSIESHSFITKLSKGEFTSVIECPTKYKSIKSKDPEAIKLQLANEVVDCWNTWKRGEKEFFEDEGIFCHVCSVTNFKDKDVDLEELKNFDDYFANTNMPGKDKTFLQEIFPYESEDAWANKLNLPSSATAYSIQEESLDLNPYKDYAAIFYYMRGEDNLKKYWNMAKIGGIGAGTGVALMSYGVVTTVHGVKIVAVAAVGTVASAGLGSIATVPAAIYGKIVAAGGAIMTVIGGAIVVGSVATAWLTADNAVDWMSSVEFREYNETVLKELGCMITPVAQS